MLNLIIGDCLETLKQMPDNSIDIILTSPPFKDADVEGDYWEFYDQFFTEAYRVCSKALCIIHSATKMNEHITRYPPKRTLIWNKGIVAYAWRFNPIFIYQKSDDYKVNKFIWSDTMTVAPIKGGNKVHQYEDPTELYAWVLRMMCRGGATTVLDPFAGSGTTAVACALLRNEGHADLQCTLIEREDSYKPLIEDKLAAVMAGAEE